MACRMSRNAQILGFYAKEANIHWGRPIPCSDDRKKLNYSSDTDISVFLVVFFCEKSAGLFSVRLSSITEQRRESILNFTNPAMAFHKEISTVCFVFKTKSGVDQLYEVVEYQKTEVQSSLQRERDVTRCVTHSCMTNRKDIANWMSEVDYGPHE